MLLPTEVLLDEDGVDRVAAEAGDGAFTVRSRHLDFVTDLAPGILGYTVAGAEHLLAVDRGLLVKCGEEVTASVRDAIRGETLESLERAVAERLAVRDERERRAISALARLEGTMVRAFLDLGWGENG